VLVLQGPGVQHGQTEINVDDMSPMADKQLGSQPTGNVSLNPMVGCHYYSPPPPKVTFSAMRHLFFLLSSGWDSIGQVYQN